VKSERQNKRNIKIRNEIRSLKGMGVAIKHAYGVVAERYYLSEERVREIWYGKKCS